MSRIFASLAFFAVLLMAAALAIGIPLNINASVGELRDLQDGKRAPREVQERPTTDLEDAKQQALADKMRSSTIHRLFGVAASLCVILVSSIAVTYFIGTSRWCREVTEVYELSPQWSRQSQRLKRKSFPWALMSMLVVLGVGMLGAAADPGTGSKSTADWVTPHFLASFGGLALVGWSFYMLWHNISENHRIIESIVRQVHEIRAAKGLEV